MDQNRSCLEAALVKELLSVEKQEKKLEQSALKAKPPVWKAELESHIPEKVYNGLESAFCKGLSLVFNQGRAIIEKGYNKKNIQADHAEPIYDRGCPSTVQSRNQWDNHAHFDSTFTVLFCCPLHFVR